MKKKALLIKKACSLLFCSFQFIYYQFQLNCSTLIFHCNLFVGCFQGNCENSSSATEIGENITNILNFSFSSWIWILAHQTKYLHKVKNFYFSQTMFIWSSFLYKCKDDSHGPKYTIVFFILSEKKRLTTFKSSSCKKLFLQCVQY